MNHTNCRCFLYTKKNGKKPFIKCDARLVAGFVRVKILQVRRFHSSCFKNYGQKAKCLKSLKDGSNLPSHLVRLL